MAAQLARHGSSGSAAGMTWRRIAAWRAWRRQSGRRRLINRNNQAASSSISNGIWRHQRRHENGKLEQMAA